METLTPQKKATEKWRKNNPKWYTGRVYVDLLNRAIRNRNPNSKIWLLAGIPLKKWIAAFDGWSTLNNGDRMEPIEGWRKFDMEKRSEVRRFLAPENFRVVKSETPPNA